MDTDTNDIVVAALYQFTRFPDPASLRVPLVAVCKEAGARGTLLLAPEGINGTIAGSRAGIDLVLQHIRGLPGCADFEHKESFAPENPFLRMKVRLKKEIVTLGAGDLDPVNNAGIHVEPADWNALISDPHTILIDTRNDYEVEIGTFRGATNPETTSFGEFPDWVDNFKDLRGKPKIAMFCTGGIRCEKSTALLKAKGFEEVYHLKGGILKYLEEVPEEDSLWEGECFVFDQRVSVGHGLVPGSYGMCHACRRPVDEAARQSEFYVPGISCPACHDERSDKQRQRYAERQQQIELAKKRGEAHIGAEAGEYARADR
jgi:UPF0176 protein